MITMDWSSVNPQEPKFTRPELLTHPVIPRSLHGFNPRTVLGEDWWNEVRKKVYAENSYCCWACGVHQSEAYLHQWLEAHECYEYHPETARVVLIEVVALCWACHAYIHEGYLIRMAMKGEVTRDQANHAVRHGAQVLARANLQRTWTVEGASKVVKGDWVLIIEGDEYPQKDWRIFS